MGECQDLRALGPHLRTSTSLRPYGFNFASLIPATQQPPSGPVYLFIRVRLNSVLLLFRH
jgi:hypothetical protein